MAAEMKHGVSGTEMVRYQRPIRTQKSVFPVTVNLL